MRHVLCQPSGSRGLQAAKGIRGPRPDRRCHRRLGDSARPGFTLVELLVVMGIILLVTAVTLSAINTTISGDRTRGAARQIQSYLEGARGRASYGAKTKGLSYQSGVRFIRDANNPNFITSMQFVEVDPASASISGPGTSYDLYRIGTDSERLVSADSSVTQWYVKYQQGLIFNGQTILIGGRRYQIYIDASFLTPTQDELHLVSPIPDSFLPAGYSTNPDDIAVAAASNTLDYTLILPPQPMANQEPRVLGNAVVLDLSLSKGLAYFTSNSLPIDIMFSPRGTVVGPLSGTGLVEFVIGDLEDSLLNVTTPNWPTSTNPNPTTKRERLILSLTPQTGKTAVHPVYIDPAGINADPFRYAETGEVAPQ